MLRYCIFFLLLMGVPQCVAAHQISIPIGSDDGRLVAIESLFYQGVGRDTDLYLPKHLIKLIEKFCGQDPSIAGPETSLCCKVGNIEFWTLGCCVVGGLVTAFVIIVNKGEEAAGNPDIITLDGDFSMIPL